MKRWILGIGMALGVSLSATASFAQGFVCSWNDTCNVLCIVVNPGIGWELNTSVTPACTHGSPNQPLTATLAILGPNGFYGPDCRLSFVNQTSGALSIVEFQQDYCVAKFGDVHVTSIEGPPPQYTIEEGSFSEGLGGLVTITGFQATTTNPHSP